MKLVIQRITEGHVEVSGETVGRVGRGLVVYVGIRVDDTDEDLTYCVKKLLGLRLWDDEARDRRWDLSVTKCGYEILLVSQFTLYAHMKGMRLDFHNSMGNAAAHPFFDKFVKAVRDAYAPEKIQTGAFGEHMQVFTQVDGPVTILVDSRDRSAP